MTLAETRAELDDRWEDASIWGDDHKDPYYAHEHIERVFRAASGERRAEMEQVFCEWLNSEESDRRMSAWTLLHEGLVMAAVAPLKALGERLAISDTPWDRDERRVVLDVATRIEAANGYDQLVCDEARTRQAASDAVDRLDAERKAWHERSPVQASVDELAYAADVLWAWLQDGDGARLPSLAAMVTANWAPDYSLSKLVLAICGAAADASPRTRRRRTREL